MLGPPIHEQLSGRKLALTRHKAGLTQSQLAQAAGIGRHAVSYWERKAGVDSLQHAPRCMLAVLSVATDPAAFL